MGRVLDQLLEGAPAYAVQIDNYGYLLVGSEAYAEDFDRLVRGLLNSNSDEFVVLPVVNEGRTYASAVLVPLASMSAPGLTGRSDPEDQFVS